MSYRTKPRPSDLSGYWLRRWSTAVRLRDNYTCCVCGKKIKPRYKASAHHVFMKAYYPEKAFDLDNGVTVHRSHHSPFMHRQKMRWTKWIAFCKVFLNDPAKRKFNRENQHKIRRGKQ